LRPFAPTKKEIPLVNFKSAGVIRCSKCRAYVNPFVVFVDDGRRWQCNFCKCLNQTPPEYYCKLDSKGKRLDISERPELLNGSCEFIAPKDYMEREPQPPSYMFVIEVTKQSVETGLLEVITSSIINSLENLPGDTRTKIGFITFDDTIQFYNLKSSLNQPQVLVIGELEDTLLPSPHGLLVDLDDSKNLVLSLLKSLPKMYAKTEKTGSCLGAAIKSAGRIIGNIGGRLSLFYSTLPNVGPNSLKNREEESLKDEKINLFNPSSEFYKEMALLYCKDKICCDIYATPNSYIDLSTIGALSQFTSGSLHYYPGFNSNTSGEKLGYDLYHSLTRETGLEAVMKVRVSIGLNISSYHGNTFIRNSNLLAFPNIDEDSVVDVKFSHSGMGIQTSNACIQTGVLFTTTSGERRIRVHTLTLPTTQKLSDLYEHCDINSTISLINKITNDEIFKNGVNGAKQILKDYVLKTTKIFKNTKQLTLPKNLILLPIYICGLSNSYAFSSDKNLRIDQRISNIHQNRSSTIIKLLTSIYPILYSICDLEDVNNPTILPLTYSSLKEDNVYLMNTGEYLYLWIGSETSEELVNDVKEVLENLNDENSEIRSNNQIKSLVLLIEKIRRKFGFLAVKVIKQKTFSEKIFKDKLIEDKNYNSFSYMDFLNFLQNEQNKF
jgi:protein transport protein SEC24